MGQSREALIAELVHESGLSDAEARQFLNALVVCMNEGLERSKRFTIPGVGILTRAAEVSDPAGTSKAEWPELEPDLTGIKPVPALQRDVVIPGVVGILGGESLTGIKPPLAEPPPDVLPLDAVIARSEGAGLPLDVTITEVFLSEAGGEPAEAGEDQGPGDVLNREP